MSPGPGATFGGTQNLMAYGGLGLGLDGQPQGMPRGHGRRHSVNVVNKSNNNQTAMNTFGLPYGVQDGYDDGFVPPSLGGHSRQVSRVDPTWRMSKCLWFWT